MIGENISALDAIDKALVQIAETSLTPLDFLPRAELAEKLIELDLFGPPPGLRQKVTNSLVSLMTSLSRIDVEDMNVVVLGGGTGLSNIIGGDSKPLEWLRSPFGGLKSIFPRTRSIVCITDDGGSTGELLKDLPLIALGDIRRVLLSSIQKKLLYQQYALSESDSNAVVHVLYSLFNFRFSIRPASYTAIIEDIGVDLNYLPEAMHVVVQRLISFLFTDERFSRLLDRPHCLGNLLLAAAIYLQIEDMTWNQPTESGLPEKPDSDQPFSAQFIHSATMNGLAFLAKLIGADPESIMPCTTTSARLQILYSNGTLVTGEYKSGSTRRIYPIDRVFVEFVDEPQVPDEVITSIKKADIIVLAPGSLFSSTIPILQVPCLADAIRGNKEALKILVSNLWVQKGETDVVSDDPKRRFQVSDLLKAYHRNIPGGVEGLFHHILTLGLRDIPGSILQSYALEDKIPIYLDRKRVRDMGFSPIEAGIFSKIALQERRVLQHDPDALARAIRTLWSIRRHLANGRKNISKDIFPSAPKINFSVVRNDRLFPMQRFKLIESFLDQLYISPETYAQKSRELVTDILWRHSDIPLNHLDNLKGLAFVKSSMWGRSQQWDNIFSFFDPKDGFIKIREDMLDNKTGFEVSFLVALGEVLLGDYAAEKKMVPVDDANDKLGKIYSLTLRNPEERNSYLNNTELDQFLYLSRMICSDENKLIYTRLVNGNEGFTPPGLLFGLIYAWYLDSHLSAHIEYKMAIMRHEVTDLIPEQIKMLSRRRSLIEFFRKSVFRYDPKSYVES